MNEQMWLVSEDPLAMLRVFSGTISQMARGGHIRRLPQFQASDRKLRLFACACCRQVWHLLTDERSRKAVEVAERYANGETTPEELSLAACSAASLYPDHGSPWIRGLPISACHRESVPVSQLLLRARNSKIPLELQASLLRDIFGNPFRPVKWRTAIAVPAGEVVATYSSVERILACNNAIIPRLAAAIYNERAFDRMPELADALEEAGCDNQDMLLHCRGMKRCLRCYRTIDNRYLQFSFRKCDCVQGWRKSDAPHVRGCWVLDLLLGKE